MVCDLLQNCPDGGEGANGLIKQDWGGGATVAMVTVDVAADRCGSQYCPLPSGMPHIVQSKTV